MDEAGKLLNPDDKALPKCVYYSSSTKTTFVLVLETTPNKYLIPWVITMDADLNQTRWVAGSDKELAATEAAFYPMPLDAYLNAFFADVQLFINSGTIPKGRIEG